MNPIFALILVNLIWGAAARIYKYALHNIPPFTFLFIRFFFASFIFYPTVRKEHFTDISKKDWIYIIVATIFGFTIQIGLLLLGLEKSTSINSSIILIGAPFMLYFLSILFLHEKPNQKVLLGILISSLGVLAIIFSPLLQNAQPFAVGEFHGNLLYVLALLGDVISIVLYKEVSRKISPFTLTFLSFVIAAVSFFPFMLLELKNWSLSMLDSQGAIGLFYAIFFSSAIGYYLYFYGLQKIKGEEIGIFGYINPIATILVAIPLLGEYPTSFFIVGSVLICVGLVVSELKMHIHPLRTIKKED